MDCINGFRLVMYILMLLFSAALLGLCSARMHYTLHFPAAGDPLKSAGSGPFYDPVVVALAVTSALAIVWSTLMTFVVAVTLDVKISESWEACVIEAIIDSVLFYMFLISEIVSEHAWPLLATCHTPPPCRVLSALRAFSILCLFPPALLAHLYYLVAVARFRATQSPRRTRARRARRGRV